MIRILSLSSSESQDQVKGWFLLNIVVRKWSSVFQLLSSEDQSLLIGRNTLFVLNFTLDGFNVVRWFDIESDGLSS